MSQTIPIPRYVDAQMQILLWEIDEVFPIVALFGIGILTDLMMYMLVLIFLLMKLFSTFKSSNLDGILMHLAYAHGIAKLNLRYPLGVVKPLVH